MGRLKLNPFTHNTPRPPNRGSRAYPKQLALNQGKKLAVYLKTLGRQKFPISGGGGGLSLIEVRAIDELRLRIEGIIT